MRCRLCCRLCSLAQHAKQETEDLLTKGSVKPEPVTSEKEEGADVKLSSAAEENNVEAKAILGECSWSSDNVTTHRCPEYQIIPPIVYGACASFLKICS